MNKNTIIILGSGNSGSGVVKDFLLGRSDIHDPLYGQEFRLMQEKGGLSDLHASLTSEFHPDRASLALIDFINLSRRLGAESKKISIPPILGYGFSKRIKNYDIEIDSFIDDITKCKFKTTTLNDLLNFGTVNWIKYMLGHLPKYRNFEKPIPVNSQSFQIRAKKLIENLFFIDSKNESSDKAKIFDQAGSFWTPVSSTQYFNKDRKVVVVSRDPRDIYAQNIRLYGGNEDDFIEYYNSIMSHISMEEWNKEMVLHVRFESFVNNYENQSKELCSFLDIDPIILSNYDPIDSRKNIGVYKNTISNNAAEKIKNNCIEV